MTRAGKRKADVQDHDDTDTCGTQSSVTQEGVNVKASATDALLVDNHKRARKESPASSTTTPNSKQHNGNSPLTSLAECSSSGTVASDADKGDITTALESPATASTAPCAIELEANIIELMPEKLVSRLRAFANYTSNINNTYSLGLLPEQCKWGERRTLFDRSTFFCAPDGRHPVSVWLLGKIIDTEFEMNGEPLKMVGIQIEPLSTTGGEDAKTIIGQKACPTILYHERWTSFKASCFVPTYKEQGRQVPRPFTAVYDASEQYHSEKGRMVAFPARLLQRGNIVLVEANIRRFVPNSANSGTNEWNTWRVKFDLVSISLIFKGNVSEDGTELLIQSDTRENVTI